MQFAVCLRSTQTEVPRFVDNIWHFFLQNILNVSNFCKNSTYHFPYIYFKIHAQNLVWNWYESMENCFPFRDEHLLFHYILASFIFYSKISIPYHALLIAHFRNQFSRVFALLSSMPRFKSINFYQNRSKLSYFCKKKKKQNLPAQWARPPHLRRLGTFPPNTQPPVASPPDPYLLRLEALPAYLWNSSLLQISGYAPGYSNHQHTKVYFGITHGDWLHLKLLTWKGTSHKNVCKDFISWEDPSTATIPESALN